MPPAAFALSRTELAFAIFASQATGARTLLESQGLPLSDGLFGGGPLGVPVGERANLAAAVRTLVGRLGRAPKEAALVLPDAWVRGLMLESAELPDDPAARLEVLRFRLKRLIPFRVEDLRVEAATLDGGETERANGDGGAERNGARGASGDGGEREKNGAPAVAPRCFATFANEALLATVEGAFADAGIRLGWISGTTAALQAGLAATLAPAADEVEGGGRSLLGLAHVDSDGFTFAVSRGGAPVVWRQKSFTAGLADADRERLLTAELRLTRTFLESRQGGGRLAALFLAAPRAVEPFWKNVLSEGLGTEPHRLRGEHVGLEGGGDGAADSALLPLAGAVAREVG